MSVRADERVVVMKVGPQKELPDGRSKRKHERISRAIVIARRLDCPLIICGDSNKGDDVRAYAAIARRSGVRDVVLGISERSSTDLDAKKAVELVRERYPHAKVMHLVTHWYHMPRAYLWLRRRFLESTPEFRIRIRMRPVFASFREGLRHLWGHRHPETGKRRNEFTGCLDCWCGCEPSKGAVPIGKPDEKKKKAA